MILKLVFLCPAYVSDSHPVSHWSTLQKGRRAGGAARWGSRVALLEVGWAGRGLKFSWTKMPLTNDDYSVNPHLISTTDALKLPC